MGHLILMLGLLIASLGVSAAVAPLEFPSSSVVLTRRRVAWGVAVLGMVLAWIGACLK